MIQSRTSLDEYISQLFYAHRDLLQAFGEKDVLAEAPLVSNALHSYAEIVEAHRHSFNLIGPKECVIDHIIDSISPLPLILRNILDKINTNDSIKSKLYIADLGSGAGFPALPFALVFNALNKYHKCDLHLYLLERKIKKADFLSLCISELSVYLKNIDPQVLVKNLSEWKPNLRLDLITFRAFRPLSEIINDLNKIARHTDIYLYKGRYQSIIDELTPFIDTSIQVLAIHKLEHFSAKERHLVHIRIIG